MIIFLYHHNIVTSEADVRCVDIDQWLPTFFDPYTHQHTSYCNSSFFVSDGKDEFQIIWDIRLFVCYCGQGSSLLWTPVLRPLCRSNVPAQGEEGIGRCVWCMCELCRVEEGLSRREQLVRYF